MRIYIPTIWALDILLILHAAPQRRWLAPELLKELRASKTLIDENLGRFERQGLVVQDEEKWCFAPVAPPLQAAVDQLANLYRERPVYVKGLIARSDPIRSLAEAFRIKRENP